MKRHVEEQEDIISSASGEEIRVRLYGPKRHALGTILFVHGISPMGIDDERQVTICRSLGGLGFSVISPEIKSIKALHVHEGQKEKLAQIIAAIAKTKKLCPSGRLSLFAPSFSGTLALSVCRDNDLSLKIRSACIVGAFSKLERVLNHWFVKKKIDDYGRLLALRDFFEKSDEKNSKREKIFFTALMDNWHRRDVPEYKKLLGADSLARDLIEVGEHWPEYLEKIKNYKKKELEAFNLNDHAEGYAFPLFLLHGKCDNVIPFSESIHLYDRLKNVGGSEKLKLLITPLLSHGDVKIGMKDVFPIIEIMQKFAFFFKHARD